MVSKASFNFSLRISNVIIGIAKHLNIKTSYYSRLQVTRHPQSLLQKRTEFQKRSPVLRNAVPPARYMAAIPPNYHLNTRTCEDKFCHWELQNQGPTYVHNHVITSKLGQVQQPTSCTQHLKNIWLEQTPIWDMINCERAIHLHVLIQFGYLIVSCVD